MIVDYDRYADVDADRIVERERVALQRRQDAQARAAGTFVPFTPRDAAIKRGGPTCPHCDGAVLLTGNIAVCNRRGCGWQGLSGIPQVQRAERDQQNSQMAERISA